MMRFPIANPRPVPFSRGHGVRPGDYDFPLATPLSVTRMKVSVLNARFDEHVAFMSSQRDYAVNCLSGILRDS
jgi:hypothetical protein